MADATKDFEDDMKLAMEYGKQALEDSAENYPRALDTQNVSTEDQHFDFVNRGPDYLQRVLGAAVFQALSSGKNYGDAVIAFLRHIKKMEGYVNE